MKLSRFNVWSLCDHGLIIFNTLTCALSVFEGDYIEKVFRALKNEDIDSIPGEFLLAMSEDGYLVEDELDELGFIRDACCERRSKTDEYSLCVILTMDCNLDCAYCFQKHSKENLSQVEVAKVLNMFRGIATKAKRIEVDWFGGEPLRSFSVLKSMNDQLMAIAQASGVDYQHSITTNGYYLSHKVITYLAKTPLSILTITLDGPAETHDRSRPTKSGQPTFLKILENVQMAIKAGLNISIRVNITTLNVDRVHELYDVLESRGLKNKVEVNLQAVVSSDVRSCEEYCLSGHDFACRSMRIYKWAAQKGWVVFPPTEKLRALGFCVGEYPNRFITDLHGNLYRCSQMTDDEMVGALDDDGSIILRETENELWINKDPLKFPECQGCSILPICMGGCNLKRRAGKKSVDYCLDWKHDLPGLLEVLVLNERNIALSQLD